VVEATQPQPDDQQHRKPQGDGEVRAVQTVGQWHAKAARAFDHHRIGLRAQCLAGFDDARQRDRYPLALRRDVRRDGST
jgi:hypothetical protein